MRATRALIHLENLRQNLDAIRSYTKSAAKLCLCVKANAYGHGAVRIAQEARMSGVEWLAVATCDEALELVGAGIRPPILLLSLPVPDELSLLIENGISATVADMRLIREIEAVSRRHGTIARVQLKVDTGMGRIGCKPEDALAIGSYIHESKSLHLEGIYTHFPAADSDSAFTRTQIRLFDEICGEFVSRGIPPGLKHAANSAGILGFPDSWYDMIRPGIIAYGYSPLSQENAPFRVRPVMELVSKIVFTKNVETGFPVSYGLDYRTASPTVVGTVSAGYGDGYRRLLSNVAEVSIRGQRFRIAGRICMDQFMVDLGASSGIDLYDDVVLFGPGEGSPDAAELASLIGTIPYEITCGIADRVPRVYLSGNESPR